MECKKRMQVAWLQAILARKLLQPGVCYFLQTFDTKVSKLYLITVLVCRILGVQKGDAAVR